MMLVMMITMTTMQMMTFTEPENMTVAVAIAAPI